MATFKIENGYSVYDSADNKIGTVEEVWENHFQMETGVLGLGRTYYVPYAAIADVRNKKVYVSTTKDRLSSMGWESKEGFLGGGVASGPELPLAGFQSAKGGGPMLAGDEKIVHTGGQGHGGTSGTGNLENERWEDISSRYRERWESRHAGGASGHWAEHEPGYRYGWEMSRRPEYKGRSWNEVEPHLRRDWQSRHADKPWERTSQSLREAWEDFSGGGKAFDRSAMREDEALGDTRSTHEGERGRKSPGLSNEGGRRDPF